MRKTIVTTLLLLSAAILWSQGDSLYIKGLSDEEKAAPKPLLTSNYNNTFSIVLPESDQRLVKKVWKTYARTHFDARVRYDRKAKEYVARDAELNSLSRRPIDLVTTAEKFGKQVRFTLELDTGEEYVKALERPRNTIEVHAILENFAMEVERERIRRRLDDQEKILHRKEARLRRLENANRRYYREIEIAKERIQRLEEKIVENEEEQIEAANEIQEQLRKVEDTRQELHVGKN